MSRRAVVEVVRGKIPGAPNQAGLFLRDREAGVEHAPGFFSFGTSQPKVSLTRQPVEVVPPSGEARRHPPEIRARRQPREAPDANAGASCFQGS
jgi:hypothetical protein